MGKSEEWFWNSIPKTFIAILDERKSIDRERLKTLAVYVGCVFSGQEFDSLEENHEIELEGIDKPISENALRSLY